MNLKPRGSLTSTEPVGELAARRRRFRASRRASAPGRAWRGGGRLNGRPGGGGDRSVPAGRAASAAAAGSVSMRAGRPRARPGSRRSPHRRRRRTNDRKRARPCGRESHRRCRARLPDIRARRLRSTTAIRPAPAPCPNPAASSAGSTHAVRDRREAIGRFPDKRWRRRRAARSATARCRRACKSRRKRGRATSVGRAHRHRRAVRCDWTSTGSLQSSPSQRKSSKIPSTNSGRHRRLVEILDPQPEFAAAGRRPLMPDHRAIGVAEVQPAARRGGETADDHDGCDRKELLTGGE